MSMQTTATGEAPSRLRADAERNRERVLRAAKQAFSSLGFQASYHDIARLAEVGVGTVYRRYPERPALLEAVLLDILDDLTAHAVRAAGESWPAFEAFFVRLAEVHRAYAGLSDQLAGFASPQVETARAVWLDKLQALCAHAKAHGLRQDIGPRDLHYLAGLFASPDCKLASGSANGHALALRVVLDGLRA